MEQNRQVSRFNHDLKYKVAPLAAALVLGSVGCSQHTTSSQESLPVGSMTLDMSHQTDGIEDTDTLSIDLEDLGIGDTTPGVPPRVREYESSEHAQYGKYGVLASVELHDDQVVLLDKSPDGMSEDVKEWFKDSIESNGTIIKTAFTTGSLRKINIGLADDYQENKYQSNNDQEQALVDAFFEDSTDTVAINFTSNNPEDLDKASTDQVILHEVMHSFFKNSPVSSFNENRVSQSTMNRFIDVCKTLRSKAIDVFNENSWQFASTVHTLAALQEDPLMRERYDQVGYNFAGGVAVDGNYPYVILEIAELNECYFPSLGQIGLENAQREGIPKPDEYNPTSIASETYYTVQDEINNDLRHDGPYEVLMESNYLDGQFDNMGHSYDGVDELAASTINILLSFPEQLATNISALPEDQKQAVVGVVRTVIDELARTNPDIAVMLHDREASLMEVLRAS